MCAYFSQSPYHLAAVLIGAVITVVALLCIIFRKGSSEFVAISALVGVIILVSSTLPLVNALSVVNAKRSTASNTR